MDITGPRISGQQIPQTCSDLGAIITGTAQGAGTVSSGDLYNPSGRGVRVVVDITAKSGTIDVVATIYSKDVASGKYISRLASVSLTGTGTTEYIVHPDLTDAANSIKKLPLGAVWKVDVVHGVGTTPSTTYTVGACLIP